MQQVGGRISMTCDGVRYSPRGKATIDNAGVENEAFANSDGSGSRTTKNKLVTAEITLDRGNVDLGTNRPTSSTINTLMKAFSDWTIIEQDTGVSHLFTQASLIGTPKLDTETGEISGLTITTEYSNYSEISS
jgi:hypothetical protein